MISGTESADGNYAFRWEERNGPAVSQSIEPGFGHTILQKLAAGIASDVRLDFTPGGLVYEIRGPIERLGAVAAVAMALA